ncbi:MAG: YHYH protein [Planctomycetaceae bacterium]
MSRKPQRPRRTRRVACSIERLEGRALLAVSPALLNSWFVSGQGQFAQVYVGQPGGTVVGPSATWSTQSSPVIGDVQKVSFSNATNTVYVNTPDLASYVMGAWWGNAAQTQPFINLPKDQNAIFKITLNSTYPSSTHSIAGNGPIGVAVNGVVFYNAGDAFTYSHASATETNPGDGLFNRLAEAVEAVTFDVGNGHQPGNGQYHYHENPVALRAQLDDNVDYVGTTNYFPYDPAVYYLTHGQGADGDFRERTTALHHSPIVGWMFDGYPVYGPYGYSDPNDPTSAVVRMQSSFALRSITTRTTLPGWAAQMSGGKLGPTAAATPADGVYTMTSTQQGQYAGPAVSSSYPLGRYGEDFAFVPGSGHLDQFNGRWCRTPEFPNGTYAYFVTVDAAGAPAFPYLVHRQFYGQTNGSGKVTSITEPVTVSFNVATNTAPVVSGPGSFSILQGGTTALSGGLRVGVSDVDEATVESVALAVTAGTLNLDLSGPLAGRVSIVSGGNHAAAVTISGAMDELNAALATLTYTAPTSGQTATLTIQANDGSASNNLSSTLSVAITLDGVTVAAGQTVIDASGFAAGYQLVKLGGGRLVLTAASSHAGGTIVQAGELVVRNIAALGSGPVQVAAGAKLTLDVGTATVAMPALALDAAGLVDLGFGRLAIAAAGIAEADLRSGILAGRGGGTWAGAAGITSSMAAASPGRAVGYAAGGDGGLVAAFAADGDTNLDGTVDIIDVAEALGAGRFDTALVSSWAQGDFSYDGVVDIIDIASLLGSSLFDAGPYLPAAALSSGLDAAFAALAADVAATGGDSRRLSLASAAPAPRPAA